jgi:hypothetical protein
MSFHLLSLSFAAQELKQGEDVFQSGQVSLSGSSDTQALAYIRFKGNHRASVSTRGLNCTTIRASCTCTKAKKGRLCHHIWATILKLGSIDSDFLANKTEVFTTEPETESAAHQEAKKRQQDFKKKVKEQNKARRDKIKQEKRQAKSTVATKYPEDVEAALRYFSENGFDLAQCPSRDALESAKKSLARVFHPDLGGTHEEVLELHKNFEVLAQFFA